MTDENSTLNAMTDILEQAGQQIILPAYHSLIHASTKADGSVVTETDLASQRFIQHALEQLNRTIAFLGEEMTETEQSACLQQSGGRYWCLDPLDGTSNFTAHFPGFAISLALIENGMVQLACIHDPVRCETFSAIRSQGACMNGQPVRASDQNRVQNTVGFIDFKRLSTPLVVKLATQPVYRSQRNIGSCALEWAWLAAGRGHFIIHGGEKIWDFAAGSLIAEEAGCTVGDFTGKPLFPGKSLS
ncbi:MAG: inositol monophosphatase family protein, partial [Mariprofundus sp.]